MNVQEMDSLTQGLTSKAAKARALFEAGVATADIGRYLKIRYQHVYNILLRAELIKKTPPAGQQPNLDMPVIVGHVGSDGCIVLPKEVLHQYGLTAGSTLYFRALPEGLMLLSRDAALEYVKQIAREKMPEQAALIEALLQPGVGGASPFD